MKRSGIFLLLLCLMGSLAVTTPAWAAIDIYHFDNTAQQDRFHKLTEELRCPKCQNESIASSSAPIARDMRRQVADMIVAGKSDDDIVRYFVDRYGSFVTYRPPFTARTAILWVGPGILLLGGLGLVIVLVRRASRRPLDEDEGGRS